MIPLHSDLTVNKYLSKKIDSQEDTFRRKYLPGICPWKGEPKDRNNREKYLNYHFRYNKVTIEDKKYRLFEIDGISSVNSTFNNLRNTTISTNVSYLNTNTYTITDGNVSYTLSNTTNSTAPDIYFSTANSNMITINFLSYEKINEISTHNYKVEYEEDDKEFHFSKERKIVKKYYRCPNCCNRIRYPHGLCSKCQNEIVTPNGDRIPWDETDGRDNDRLITNDRFLWTTEDDQNKNQFAVNRIPWKIEDDDTTELNIGHIGIDTFNTLNVLSFNRSSL